MPDADELNEGINVDLNSMRILLLSKANRTSITIKEFIRLALLNGSSREAIKKELLRDLKENGRIFGEFRSAIKATSNGVINRMRDSAEFSELGFDQEYRWVAVLVNTCPDCIERHGVVMTFDEWKLEGLPRTGHTVCKENCKCVLLPENSTILEPLRRNKK